MEEGKIYDGLSSEEYQVDIQHKFHDTLETFEVYECPECKGHFLVESEAVESIAFLYCPYCKKEFSN